MERKRILVVDDDPVIGSIMDSMLSTEGYITDISDNALYALELINQEEYDLVLTDIVMEGIDGLELLRRIKKKKPRMPVLLMTGYATFDTAIEALRAGACDYMKKPVSKETLLLRVGNVIKGTRLEQEKEEAELERDGLREEINQLSRALEVLTRKNKESEGQARDAFLEGEKSYGVLFEDNRSAMLLVDPETMAIVAANVAACSFYGYDKKEFAGKKLWDIYPVSKEEIRHQVRLVEKGEERLFFAGHRPANGQYVDIATYAGPIQIRGRKLIFSITHDVTGYKEAEKRVKRRKEEISL